MTLAEALVKIRLLHKKSTPINGKLALTEAKFRLGPASASIKQRARISYQKLIPPPVNNSEFLTIRQASSETNLSQDKIRKLCQKKKILAKKENKIWLVYKPSLDAYLKQMQ